MAKREALRELQSRLARRLQEAGTELPAASWLAVHSAGAGLIFPLQTAGEIFTAAGVLPVPHTQPWFLGVANLRGGLHGVVDLGGFLGLRPRRLAPDTLGDQARLLALNPGTGAHCALLVDRLSGLRNAAQLTRLPESEQARPAFAGGRYRDAQGQVWQEIDLAALAQQEQFLGIAG
ncbi:chemotaxis protein CheW [Pseudorhodoferax sp.]|uniref:chemotaxis protein CheW n=1 Tax=Pseudorhodoferax sp. TaxID=1993553 RepID=UPI002DD690E2|nr:chemotaxis protein CheW [Pseudorhodoferax sp.]